MSLRRVLPSRANSPAGAEGSAAAPKTEINQSPVTPAPTPDSLAAASTPTAPVSTSAALAMFAEPITPLPAQAAPTEPAPAPAYASIPDPIAAEPVMPAPLPPAETTPAPAAPAQPENLTPSLPAEGMVRRQFRAKEPRQFQQPAPTEPESQPAASTQSQPTENLAQVSQRLSDAGLTPTPASDTLTTSLPPQLEAQATPEVPDTTPPAAAIPPLPESRIEAPTSNVVSLTPSAPTTPSYQAPSTGLQATTSDLPWANPTVPADDANSGWNINFPTSATMSEGSAQPAPAAQPTDLFSPAALSSTMQAPRLAAPEIMANSQRQSGPLTTPTGGGWQLMAAAAVVAAVIGGAYWFVSGQAQAPQLALGMPAPSTSEVQTPAESPTAPLGLLPPPDPATANTIATTTDTTTPSSSAIIAFTDVPPAEAGQPIVADTAQKMPEDVSFIANLQQAIAAEKGKKDAGSALGAAEATTPNTLPTDPIARLEQGEDLKKQLDAELAAYREALANTPKPLAPKPTEFFEGQKGFMNGAPATAEVPNPNTVGTPPVLDSEGAPLPPPTASTEIAQDGTLPPPNELYADNPAALPIVGKPSSAEAPRVRQLNDFNVAMFEPEKDKIRIPQGVKPKFSTTDFPSMEVLSFVPGKGLIAYKDGKEGVLLMGEELEGWQLVAVSTDVAEFRSGRRTQYVSAE